MLGKDVETAGAKVLAVALALGDGVACRHGFEEFEPVPGTSTARLGQSSR
jgi:hypothetical protein